MLMKQKNKSQAIIEFTFCMIVVFLMFYAVIKIFRWSGVNLAERRKDHEAVLTSPIVRTAAQCTIWNGDPYCVTGCCLDASGRTGPLKQIDPYFSQPTKMNAIWGGP